jgi:biopolymer transport protein ExbD
MKIRNRHASETIRSQMTAMIDIVFLLLVFFVLTFRVAAPEGDLKVAMRQPNLVTNELVAEEIPLTLELRADAGGGLAGIRLNERAFDSLAQLHAFVVEHLDGDERRRAATELELRPDHDLAYAHVIEAMTAVRGRRTPDGRTHDLITNIRFAPR